ncbi:hypothetical protein HRI_005057000 [Hibiscus trionum]|uniref:Reverse transcriptase domain-containing protein n=1 Tax=Hibiscus trionum TaxID=183268 RepID=A0A9W7JFW1_HIBTR|nr:hypothetical protein HRI_005057000 [Hibiscus trionum]
MLLRMRFDEFWVSTLMNCVTFVSYSVNCNGSIDAPFVLTHGLRQGDLLSPYLFLICVEGLSSILHNAKALVSILGSKVGRFGVSITHILLIDDIILFGHNTLDEATELKELITIYEEVSG